MSLSAYPNYKDSCVEWLGEVPGHWEVRKSRWLCEIKKRISGELGHDVLSITQLGIRVRDLESNDGQLSMDYSKYQFVEVGDFAMNHMDLLTGYVDIASARGVTSPDYRVFSIRDPGVCFDKYLLYLFQMGYKNRIFYAYGQGSSQLGRWRLPTEQFQELAFPLPPKTEQTQIAAFLDRETAKIDELVAEQRRLMALLKEKRQAVISHAVTRGLNPHAPLKPSGIEWLGDVPAHWVVTPLGVLADQIQTGPFGSQLHSSDYIDDGTPVINPSNIQAGKLIPDLSCTVDLGIVERLAQHKLKLGDIVFGRRGEMGRCAMVSQESVGWLCGTGSLNVRLSPKVAPSFVSTYLGTDYVRELLQLESVGSTMDNLNTGILAGIPVPTPPLPEQQLISQFLAGQTAKFDTLTTETQRAIALLQERRTALMSAAVTGQIDVRGTVAV